MPLETGVEYLLGSLMDALAGSVYEPQWSFEPVAESKSLKDSSRKCWKGGQSFLIFTSITMLRTNNSNQATGRTTWLCVDAVDRLLRAGVFVDLYE